MVTTFPQLLIYGFFAPTLLRITAGITLFFLAHSFWRERAEIIKIIFPIIGRMPRWLVWFSILFEVAVGIALVVGYGTQVAAILGIITALKHLFWWKRFAHLLPFSRSTYYLLAVICISLLFTGAGALAFDLPV